jgi:hypothetical protein
MPRRFSRRFVALLVVNVLGWCMLTLHQTGAAPNPPGTATPPFANSVEQRFETIDQLKQINAQLKEQNAFLRSGALRVIVELPPKK